MSTLRVEPLWDNLVVRVGEAGERKAGPLVIPETAVQQSRVAEVLAVGPDVDKDWLSVGDRVFIDGFGHYALEDADPAMRGVVLISQRAVKARVKTHEAGEGI